MNPAASISTGSPRKNFPVRANFKVCFTERNKRMGTTITHMVPGSPAKLSNVKGWKRNMAGITGNRLFIPLQSFFRIPFTDARTSPASMNAKVVFRKALDWKAAVRTVFPKMLPLPRNSRKTVNRIHSPQTKADSRRSSPYSPSVFPESACFPQIRGKQ